MTEKTTIRKPSPAQIAAKREEARQSCISQIDGGVAKLQEARASLVQHIANIDATLAALAAKKDEFIADAPAEGE